MTAPLPIDERTEAPHEPRACPFQAWSVAEALPLAHGVLAEKDVVHQPAVASA